MQIIVHSLVYKHVFTIHRMYDFRVRVLWFDMFTSYMINLMIHAIIKFQSVI